MSNATTDTLEKCKYMGRREFLRLSGAAAAGMALAPFLGGCEAEPMTCRNLPVVDDYSPQVSGIWVPNQEYNTYYEQFTAMIEDITDFSWLKPNDVVLVKLALNSGLEFPATTDPWVLECMLKLLNEKGVGRILVGDQCGVEYVVRTADIKRGSSRQACISSGLYDVITECGATPVFFEERVDDVGYEEAYVRTYPVESHQWPTHLHVTSHLDRVDHIIYLPRVASHLIAGITSGMKIGIGFLRDDSRLALHQAGDMFYALYEEVNDIPQIREKLRLIVSSGRKVLRTSGPDTGDIVTPDYGLVFASDDLLAHEVLAYAWLKYHNHQRSAITPSVINSALINTFFAGVEGRMMLFPGIPEIASNSVYCHPAIYNFMKRKGGRPKQVIWNNLNDHPDQGVTDRLNALLTFV